MIEYCSACNKSLGTTMQDDLFGAPKKCIQCQTKDRASMMLKVLPDDDDPQWSHLSEFEQSFLPSVREQFARRGMLSEKQFQVLERIYEKHN